MRLSINWLPLDLQRTHEVARAAERAGLWGMGIADSPNYGELYTACTEALRATDELVVSTCVTNPVTRHWSVHASAARALGAEFAGRFRLGMGRGDSAVNTFGLPPARTAQLESVLRSIREAAPGVPLLVAASGMATSRMAGRVADGVIAGVGVDVPSLAAVREAVTRDGASGPMEPAAPAEVWATVRIGVGRDDAHVAELRRRFVPRAISAAHFAFSSTFEGKNVPPELQGILAERFARYDYSSHGRSGATSNAELFADRPDVEDYLVDRFAVIGTTESCRIQLARLDDHVEGVYLSLLFEDALPQIELLAEIATGG